MSRQVFTTEDEQNATWIARWIMGIIATFVVGGGMFWLNSVYASIGELRSGITSHVERLVKTESAVTGLDGRLHRMENKLDQLIDRRIE